MMSKADFSAPSIGIPPAWQRTRVTAKQVRLVQKSFKRLVPIADKAAALFYDRFFALDPSVQPMFEVDINVQGEKLMETLAWVVHHLEEPETFMDDVRELGKRHVSYGVKPEHYLTMREALFWMLAQALGDEFTDEVAAAWAAAYALLADAMLSGAAGEEEDSSKRG